MKISEAQIIVDKWINSKGVRYFSELTNFAILTEEVGELGRIFSRKFGEQSYKENEKNLDIEEEFGDVFWVILALANQTNIDLTKALEKSIYKKNKRDSKRHINNTKLSK